MGAQDGVVPNVVGGELAELEFEDADGDDLVAHAVPIGPGEMRCVLPPRRSSSVEAGLPLSTDTSVLVDASCA